MDENFKYVDNSDNIDNIVDNIVSNGSISDLIKISRQALDIAVWGRKSRGKSFVLAINAWLAYLEGKTVFSNMWLNFPFHPIETMKDFQDLQEMDGEKFLLLDDAERYISSKFLSASDKSEILSLTLDMAKYRTSIWFSTKRLMECDKTLRSGIDYSMECNLELFVLVYTVEDFDSKSQYLNNCRIRTDIFDGDGFYLKTEYYYDLDVFKDLFSTTQVVKHF